MPCMHLKAAFKIYVIANGQFTEFNSIVSQNVDERDTRELALSSWVEATLLYPHKECRTRLQTEGKYTDP